MNMIELRKENAALKKALKDMALKSVGLMGRLRMAEREKDAIIEEIKQFAQNLGEKR